MTIQNPQHNLSRVSFPKSERQAPSDATLAGRLDPQRNISVSVIVKRKSPLDLEKIGGRHLSQQEFLAKYGADPANFEHLRDFAHKHGLTVDEGASSLARRTLVLRGPASKIEAAFGVTLNEYATAGKTFHSYTGAISVPQEHAEPVEAVLGLDNHPIARPHFRMRAAAQANQASPFNPPDVGKLYNFPTGVDGSGQTIGILELGGGYNPGDLSNYFSGLGIAEPRVTAVSVDGASNSPNLPDTPDNPNADGEVALDIEVAGSIAPGANIAVYFTTNTSQGFVDALTTAIHDTTNGPPSVISISWGSAESNWTAQAMTTFDDACQSAAALGITVTVASGDDGSSDRASGNNVDFPASSPHVLGCGGTELIAANGAIQSEVVWNDQAQGGGATGGGVSNFFPLPSWQQNANVPAPAVSGGGRGVPDVAGDAAPATGYNVSFDGQSVPVGGTSAVAPLWAALIVLLNQGRGSNIGFANPTLYQNAGSLNDITQGNNGAFTSGPGWDACTGLGSPNGNQLPRIFAGTTTTAAQPVPAAIGD